MSRLSKHSLYKMATSNNCRFAETIGTSPANGSSAPAPHIIELSAETVILEPIDSQRSTPVPDGRLLSKVSGTTLQQFRSDDAISVSSRARRNSSTGVHISRGEVLRKLGNTGLGFLTNAYLEQTLMRDEEIHTVQQKFYGLNAV